MFRRWLTKIEDIESICADMGQLVASTLDIEQVYEQFVSEVKKLVGSDWAVINLFDTTQASFTVPYVSPQDASYFIPGQTFPIEGTFNSATLKIGRTMIWGDIAEQGSEFWSVQYLLKEGRRSLISVPLMSSGRVLGTFAFLSNIRNAYGRREQRILECLALQITPAIENARLYDEAKEAQTQLARLADESAAVAEIGRIIGSSLDTGEVYEQFATKVQSLIGFDNVSINTIDVNKGTLCAQYRHSSSSTRLKHGDTIPLAGSLSGEVTNAMRTLIVDVPAVAGRFSRGQDWVADGYLSGITTPLFSKETVIGTFVLFSKQINAYGLREQRILERLALQITPAIENARLYDEAKEAQTQLARLADESAAVSSGPHHQDSGEAKIRESTAGVSRKPSSDGKARGCSSKHLWGLTAWNT